MKRLKQRTNLKELCAVRFNHMPLIYGLKLSSLIERAFIASDLCPQNPKHMRYEPASSSG